jgi:signal transduction histidine kinase
MKASADRSTQPRLDSLSSVLIIDDDDDDVLIIKERLTELGASSCDFIVCQAKEKAIDLLKTNQYDLCLLDHRLGYFEGIEILEALDNELIITPIIMLTGQDDARVESLAIKRGAQDYIMKSAIDSEVFAKSIRYAVSRKELEFTRVSHERMRSENVAKDKFIAHLSHELRTPLTSILGYTSLLLENDIAAPLQKELSIIANNGKHLLNLLNDVLDLSKIAAGKFELHLRDTDLHQLVTEVYSLLSVNAMDKGLTFDCVSTTAISHRAMLDEVRLKQVLINLVGNAIKFTDKGGINMSLSQTRDGHLTIAINDSGIGMQSQQMECIFTPFQQVEDVADRKAGGAGLGLSISAEIVKQIGGTIEVDSIPQKGTTFRVILPLKTSCNDERAHIDFALETIETKSSKVPQLTGKVLIVDDIFEIRQLIGQFVKQMGCEVTYARNGEAAIEVFTRAIAKNAPFDAVLMDLHMPVMTGQEAVKHIKSISPSLPVIAITAAIQKGTSSALFDVGFTGLLAKPVERERLLNLLQEVLPSNNQAPASGADNSGKMTEICLIEDDIDSANIMQVLLSTLNYSVSHYADGQSCISALDNYMPDCFLVDLGLPDMSAEVLLRKLRERAPQTDVVILSGSEVTSEFVNKFDIKGHLLKPVSLAQLKTFF